MDQTHLLAELQGILHAIHSAHSGLVFDTSLSSHPTIARQIPKLVEAQTRGRALYLELAGREPAKPPREKFGREPEPAQPRKKKEPTELDQMVAAAAKQNQGKPGRPKKRRPKKKIAETNKVNGARKGPTR